jgi:D-alanine-D-alanine ligase
MKFAILFGGSSHEHEVSIVSAITIKKVLKKSSLQFVFVSPQREFYLIDTKDMKAKYFSSGGYKKCKKLILKRGDFYTEGMLGSKPIDSGTVLNLIHGRDGEDGKIAAMLEFHALAYISPRLEAASLSYNKLYTKYLAHSVGVASVEYEYFTTQSERVLQMEFPVIVKPVRLGSSIGLSVASNAQEFDYALDVAFEFDDAVIVEKYIENIKEYNQAGAYTNKWELSIVEEPAKDGFLDFDKKYMDFSRDGEVGSASISDELREQIQESFQKIYDPLFHGAIIRCDFFVIDGKVYLNEINPVPGSMANYLFDNFEKLLEDLANNLYSERNIPIDYQYIHSINSAKGKA